MITQRLNGAGDWALNLDRLPAATLNRLTLDEDHLQTLGAATLVVTESWIDPTALGNEDTGTAHHPLFDLAIYTGTVTGLSGNRDEISGVSTHYWLGTPEDTGELFIGADLANLTRTARVFLLDTDEWFDWLVLGGTQSDVTPVSVTLRPSGLYDTDFYSAPVTNVPYFPEALTRAEVLSRICDYIGWQWYITPQMVVRAGDPDDLFPSPRAVIATDLTSDPEWWTITSPSIEVDETIAGYVNKVAAFNTTSPPTVWSYPTTTPAAHFYRPDGTAAHIVGLESAQQEETSSDWAARAATIVPRRDTIRRSVQVAGSVHSHGYRLIPGEPMYVYEPAQGLVGTAEVHVGGQTIHPAVVRLESVQWPVVEGMGVYLVYWDKAASHLDTLDLTRNVVAEQAATSLEVGAAAAAL